MKCLELFCGTKSISKQLPPDWEVVSVDILSKFKPTICVDVLQWDFREYPSGYFDYIHLSPPCTEFSQALTRRPRNLEVGDALAKRALEILEHFQPRWWTLENPATGLLPKRPYMEPYRKYLCTVCYCKYNDDGLHAYKKPTAIWTNLRWEPREMCNKRTPCPDVAEHGVHLHAAYSDRRIKRVRPCRLRLYSIPGALVREWLACMHD